LQRVQSFRPSQRAVLEAATGGVGPPVAGLLACGAALALLWQFWIVRTNLDDDPFELASGGIGTLALAFAAGWSATYLIGEFAGRRPRGAAQLVLTTEAHLGAQMRGDVRLPWLLRQDESAVAVLQCEVRGEDAEGAWTSASATVWWSERVTDGAAADAEPGTRLPLAFDIPPLAPPSGTYQIVGGGRRLAEWTLDVSIEPGGRVLHFLVPVSGPLGGPVHVSETLEADAGEAGAHRPAHSRITVQARDPDVVEYTLPRPLATAWLAAWVTLTAPLWIILPWLVWRDGRDLAWSLPAMLAIAACVNGVPLLLLMQPRTLRVAPDAVSFHRWLRRVRRWPLWDIRGATTSALRGPRPRYVCFQRTSGLDVPVYGCTSASEARWFARDLDRALSEAKQRRTARLT
jgi:hypothetical protein